MTRWQVNLFFLQSDQTRGPTAFFTELGTPMYWAVVALGTLVFFLAAVVIIYLIRDARHRGREEILTEVRHQGQQDRTLLLELYQSNLEKNFAAQAAQQRDAAKLAEAVPIALPLDYRRRSTASERRQAMKSFSDQRNYPLGLNPFERRASASFAQPPQQPEAVVVAAQVHAAPQQQQQQQPEAVVGAQPEQPQQHPEVVVVTQPKQPPQQPEAVVVAAQVHAAPQQQQQQPKAVVVAAEAYAAPQHPKAAVVAQPKQLPQQPEAVVVAAQAHAAPQQQQQPKIVAAAQPEQPQLLNEVEVVPKFSLAFNGIRAKLEKLFEPRPQQQQQHQPKVVAAKKQQQPEQVVADAQEAHPPEAVVAKPQTQQPPVQAVVDSGQPTATIKRPSAKMRRAPPPPTLPKPKMASDAGASRGTTLPRPQKQQQTMASNEGASALNQATSSANLNQAQATKRVPPPPQRRSSLRNLSSLRRSRSVPMKDLSKRDFSTQFLDEHDLWDDEERFVTYV